MKILLIGEYSNVHWTLAEGLRSLGHEVTVVSDGDSWKNYRRDISLVRRNTSLAATVSYAGQLLSMLPRWRGYDVVQVINPMFLSLKAERIFPVYRYLRRHNGRVFMGAYGMDYYWVHICRTTGTFRYSDFNIGKTLRTNPEALAEVADWVGTAKERLNRFMATDCDGIPAGLYEYYACYRQVFPVKTCYIPFPVNLSEVKPATAPAAGKIRFFIGIQRHRSAYKGTDVMLRALERLHDAYPDRCEIVKAESVPYPVYRNLMDGCHVLLDQLYSYTPAMNGLLAMAKGMVLVGGGEEEAYRLLGEGRLRPIVNVEPDEDDVYCKLEQLVLHPDRIAERAAQSRELVEKYHDHVKVAGCYVDFWSR